MKLYKQVNNQVEMCIFPAMEAVVSKMFGEEIGSGLREELPDGRIFFSFTISEEKAALLLELSTSIHLQEGKWRNE